MNESSISGAGKLLIAFAAALAAWQIVIAADPSQVAVDVLMAVGVATLVALLLFARDLSRLLSPSMVTLIVATNVIWLVLSFGVTQWDWNVLPDEGAIREFFAQFGIGG